MVYQSRLYALQKGFKKQLERLGKDTYCCTEALHLHSVYNGVPRRKMLWELMKDCHNALVADNIRQDDVDAVLQCLHFRDNSLLNGDAYFKVRPVFENLNKSSKYIKIGASSGSYSVDEMMVPYYGRHNSSSEESQYNLDTRYNLIHFIVFPNFLKNSSILEKFRYYFLSIYFILFSVFDEFLKATE